VPISCEEQSHRHQLLASDFAACYDCLSEFSPADIRYWCDDGNTALCPYCGLDFVLGFNDSIDRELLIEANKKKFPWRWKDAP
jgi:hypothetical protein